MTNQKMDEVFSPAPKANVYSRWFMALWALAALTAAVYQVATT